MYPPIFAIVAADTAVKAALGVNPTRFWPFGQAKADGLDASVSSPYAVWQTIYGSPENYINDKPDVDNWGVQIDVYANTVTLARNTAKALRDALETKAHVVSWRGESWEAETTRYRYSFDVEFWTPR